jgi:hypothetical protein
MADRPRGAGGGNVVGAIVGVVDLDDGGLDEKVNRLLVSMDAVEHAMADVGTAGARIGRSFTHVATTADVGAKGAQAFSRSLVEISRGIEDFTVAGPLGVLNNIPGIFTNMAAAAGVTGAALGVATAGVSLLATGAYILYRNWDSLTGLWEERNPFPESAESLRGMEGQLRKVKDAIDDLQGLSSLDNAELARANTLLAERDRLEKEITAEKEHRAKIDAFLKGKTEEESARGGAFTKSVGEDRAGFIDDVKAAMDREAEFSLARARGRAIGRIAAFDATGATQEEKNANYRREVDAFEDFAAFTKGADRTRLAEELTKKLGEGDAKALERLRDLMAGGTGVLIGGEGFAARLEANDPEVKAAAARNKAIDEETDRRRADALRMRQEDAERTNRPIDEETDRRLKLKQADDREQRARLLAAMGPGGMVIEDPDQARNDLTAAHGRRLAALMAPEDRRSMVMDASQAWASVQQSISAAPSEEAKRMAEVRDEIKQFRDDMRKLGRPVNPGRR